MRKHTAEAVVGAPSSAAGANRMRLRWTILAITSLVLVLNYADRAALAVAGSHIINEFSLTKTEFGFISSIFFLGYAPFCFVGGTLVPIGGHNPLEAARLDCAVLFGPHTESFPQAYDALLTAHSGIRVSSAHDIAHAAQRLLADPAGTKTMGEAAAKAAAALGGAVAKTLRTVEALLDARA